MGEIPTSEEAEKIKFRIEHLTNLIASLSASQRQLTVSALDLQALALAKKRQIKDSIDRAVELGQIQDVYIELLKDLTTRFVDCIDEIGD